MQKKNILIIITILVVVIVGGLVLFRDETPNGSTQTVGLKSLPNNNLEPTTPTNFVKGQLAPEVVLTGFDGKTYNLSDFKNRAVVLDFWAAWCPFCVAEMPELQKAQDSYPDELVIVGVHRSDTEGKDVGQNFAQERAVRYLLVSDDGSLYRSAGGFGMPVAIFIDREGRVTEIKSGPKTEEEIKEKISNLVGGGS